MSEDGEQLYRACDSSDPQKALQLVTSWDQQRIRDAAQYKGGRMCDSSSDLYKETRALLATDPKQRPSLFSARNIAQQPALAQVGPAIDVLRDAPELISEVGELLKQLNTGGRGPANIAVQRVDRVHNPVLWERYSAKRREMLHRIKNQVHYDQLQTATSDAPSGSPALLRDASCQERLLLHGIAPDTMLRDKIVRLGLDYRFAGSSAGHRFGLGVYLADHPGKSHQYAGAGPNGERMLVITRALLGHAHVHPSPPSGALAPPLLPNAPNNERLSSWLEKRGRLDTPDDYAVFRRQTTTYLYRPTLGVRRDLLDDGGCNPSTLGRDDQRPWQPIPRSSLALWRHGRANDHVQTKLCFERQPVKSTGCITPERFLLDKIVRFGLNHRFAGSRASHRF
ncbi:uncharacterized protein MONBRDRAFT_13109 [Monosiga brevicollis MX1]|uniref:PARP catalytic domain-containing protein n=1 Tax=Monosiga brevicollis TaxID=81824 RepID=A9VEB4_MONBE|nr:uncharacterized protein MONBRDRAFT_13109 [Monosiga brevicollis MX1]EDQ84126.1 predicted protein [Monosiga brevicollis MX1]|eukprot:XP_001751061.1 hypothetical protein [Monosiga brevicollis MX1]